MLVGIWPFDICKLMRTTAAVNLRMFTIAVSCYLWAEFFNLFLLIAPWSKGCVAVNAGFFIFFHTAPSYNVTTKAIPFDIYLFVLFAISSIWIPPSTLLCIEIDFVAFCGIIDMNWSLCKTFVIPTLSAYDWPTKQNMRKRSRRQQLYIRKCYRKQSEIRIIANCRQIQSKSKTQFFIMPLVVATIFT